MTRDSRSELAVPAATARSLASWLAMLETLGFPLQLAGWLTLFVHRVSHLFLYQVVLFRVVRMSGWSLCALSEFEELEVNRKNQNFDSICVTHHTIITI